MSSKYKVITYSVMFSIAALLGLMFEVFLSTDTSRIKASTEKFLPPGGIEIREPSSISKTFIYSDVGAGILLMAQKDNLINSVDIERHNYDLDIVMENFIIKGENNSSVSFCGYFDTTSFEFEAEGVMVEGERPTLTLEAPCSIGANAKYLSPVHFPLKEITSGHPGDSEMKFRSQGKLLKVIVKDCPPQWPSNWVLRKVTMTSSKDSSKHLEVPSFEAGMGHRSQIVMRW